MPLAGFQISQVGDAAEGLVAAKKLLDDGTDGIKFYAATPGRNDVVVPEAAMQAGVKEAHARGKPVFSHPSSEAGLMASVHSGVDVVAHTPSTKFGESARLGRVAVGLAADLTVLSDDPSRDVHAFTSVQYTLRDGNVIYQRPTNYQLPTTNH